MSEWRRGWRTVLGCAVGSGVGAVLLFFTFSLFILPIAKEFDATRGEIATVQSLIIAGALGARLVLLTDTDGVWGADRQRIPTLTVAESERLIGEGVIVGGMVPKVRCAERAMRAGAAQAVIADGAAADALARALDDRAFGTRWTG